MRITIPRQLTRIGDWLNASIDRVWGFELTRVDVLLAIGFGFCVGYYYVAAGWTGALYGAAVYAFVVAASIVVRMANG